MPGRATRIPEEILTECSRTLQAGPTPTHRYNALMDLEASR